MANAYIGSFWVGCAILVCKGEHPGWRIASMVFFLFSFHLNLSGLHCAQASASDSIMFYALFPLSEPASVVDLAMVSRLIARVVLVNVLMIAVLIVLNQMVVFPLLKFVEQSFGLEASVDHHI